VVQRASKEAAKGALSAAKEQVPPGELVNRAKDVTKGVAEGAADAVPQITSQFLNQCNRDRRAIGHVARQVADDAVGGALAATVQEADRALGPDGDGPLARTLAATLEKTTAASMRGLVTQIHLDPQTVEQLTAAGMRGAVSELPLHFRVWPYVLVFILGGFATFICGLGLTLLYLLFENKRDHRLAPGA
jgi:hypothetical protein